MAEAGAKNDHSLSPTCLAQPATTATSPGSSSILPMDKKVNLGSITAEESPRDLPAPLRDREFHVEQDFHGLLER